MNPHPLATLRFETAGPKVWFEPFERPSYHVPRVGDIIEIDLQGDGEEIVRGYVREIVWRESHVVVRLV